MASTLPPIHINQKVVKNNLFSKHDNRHAFQDSGVYFGQGFGKRLVKDSKINQHHSHLCISWDDTPHPSHSSTYKAGYCSKERDLKNYVQSAQRADASLLKKFHTPLKSNFRHFPRNHQLPENPANTKPTTHTTNWFGDKTHTTPLFVLAATQQPFVKLNPWKFSY